MSQHGAATLSHSLYDDRAALSSLPAIMALLESDSDLETALVRAFAIIGVAAQLQRVRLGSDDEHCHLLACEWLGPQLLSPTHPQRMLSLSVPCGDSRCERLYFERRPAAPWGPSELLAFDILGRAVGAALARREMTIARLQLEQRYHSLIDGESASFERRRALHLLIASIPSLLLLVDVQDRVTALFAPAQYRPHIESRGIDIGAPLLSLFPDEQSADLRQALMQVRVRREGLSLEIQIELEGARRWLQLRLSPVSDSSEVLVLIDDISEQRQAEAALRRRDAILEVLAETSEALLLGDPDTLIPPMLARLGQTLRVSQAALFDLPAPGSPGSTLSLRAVWAGSASRPLTLDDIAPWLERLLAGQAVHASLDQSTGPERDSLERLALSSIALAPVLSDGRCRSLLCFAEGQHARPWLNAEIEALKNIAAALGAAFARQRIQAEEQEQRALTEALRDIGATLNRTLDLDQVLDQILENLGRVVPHDSANIILLDEGLARVARARGYVERGALDAMGLVYFPVNTLFSVRQIIEAGQPVAFPDTCAIPTWATHEVTHQIRSYAGAPIRVEGELIGLLNVDSATPGFITQAHAERLQAFADQAAIAIRNARLYRRVESLAAFQERQRLARELHDGVSQSLSSANLIADVLPRVWQQSPERGQAALNQLHQLTGSALAEMRMLLMELRPETIYDMKLQELLVRLVRVASSRAGIDIDLTVEGDREPDSPIKYALYRISQESLNNIVKHSGSTHAQVRLLLGPGVACLCVEDDGTGFNPALVPPDHYGLRFMRERAEEVGALLTIDSRPGQGTRIEVRWLEEGAN